MVSSLLQNDSKGIVSTIPLQYDTLLFQGTQSLFDIARFELSYK